MSFPFSKPSKGLLSHLEQNPSFSPWLAGPKPSGCLFLSAYLKPQFHLFPALAGALEFPRTQPVLFLTQDVSGAPCSAWNTPSPDPPVAGSSVPVSPSQRGLPGHPPMSAPLPSPNPLVYHIALSDFLLNIHYQSYVSVYTFVFYFTTAGPWIKVSSSW